MIRHGGGQWEASMFTGIVEEIGRVESVQRSADGWKMRFAAKQALAGTVSGDSIAVNGVCLTVTEFDAHSFCAGVAPETRRRTNLAGVRAGDRVNLERSVTPSTRMGGHFVQGHVDCVATIREMKPDGEALSISLGVTPEWSRYIVNKGYVCLDGASLTVVEAHRDWFSIMLVAYTREHITLARKTPGDGVNLEVDIIGKYVERLLLHGRWPDGGERDAGEGLTIERLADMGYQ
jgi:riboflavin synthase